MSVRLRTLSRLNRVCQCAIGVPQCILPVYVQYTLNTLKSDLGGPFLRTVFPIANSGSELESVIIPSLIATKKVFRHILAYHGSDVYKGQ